MNNKNTYIAHDKAENTTADLLVVSDIFGKTSGLEALCTQLTSHFDIIDPYNGAEMSFNNEGEAYRYFSENIGLEGYCSILTSALLNRASPKVILGFSVGASAIWKLSDSIEYQPHLALGFYSSQIRHYLDIVPSFPYHLVFPKEEKHFDVNAVMGKLNTTTNVSVESVPYLHGFMNTHSANFDEKGYRENMDELTQRLLPYLGLSKQLT